MDAIAAIGELLAARIPGARRMTIQDADHIPPVRAPHRLAEFLAEQLR